MAVTAPVIPDYRGANVSGVVPAILAEPAHRPAWLPEPARTAGQVVLLVLDGLGWTQLNARRHLAPVLSSMEGAPVMTVAPSTTACALTSLVTGKPPAVHGVVGYRVAVKGPAGHAEVMNVLKWKTQSGDAREFVDPGSFCLSEPFLGRPVPVVSKAEFTGTPFTVAHQGQAPQMGWYAPSGMAVEVARLIAAGQPVVYAYYDGIDRVAHMKGFGDHYDAELAAVDRLVEDHLEILGADVALLVTADHGQVEVAERVVELDPGLLSRCALVSGEPRFRWLHASPGTSPAELAEVALDLYGHQAWVSTYEEVVAAGWLGGEPDPVIRKRLGDVAVVPWEPVAYLGTGEAAESRLRCRHGSLTEDEMLVPLLAARGRLEA